MNRLVTWFLRGLVYLVPIGLTIAVFVWSFRALDGLIGDLLGTTIPGVGLAVLVVLTTGFGFLLSGYLSGRLLALVEGALDRLPFVRLLHSSAKDLMAAFVGEHKRFDAAVAVELIPGSGVRALGFVTRPQLGELGLGDAAVAVYFPQAYNWAGQLLLVPRERIEALTADAAQMMAFIVSGGVSAGAAGGAPGRGRRRTTTSMPVVREP